MVYIVLEPHPSSFLRSSTCIIAIPHAWGPLYGTIREPALLICGRTTKTLSIAAHELAGGSETVIGLALKEDPAVDELAFVTTKRVELLYSSTDPSLRELYAFVADGDHPSVPTPSVRYKDPNCGASEYVEGVARRGKIQYM